MTADRERQGGAAGRAEPVDRPTDAAGEEDSRAQPRTAGPTRRGLFAAAGAALVAGAAGWGLRGVVDAQGPAPEHGSGAELATQAPSASAPARPLPRGDRRPGITSPAVPQRYVWAAAVRLPGLPAQAIRDVAARAAAAMPELPADAGEPTVTIGFAPAVAQALWGERASAASELPAFANDDVALVTGGDLALQICAETASGVTQIVAAVRAELGEHELVWTQTGYRDGPTPQGTARTSTGFVDGIVNPRSTELLAAGVWTDAEHHDTYLVFRRMRIDASFTSLPDADQERAIGRRKDTGAPLSGGGPLDDVDLFAKAPDGTPLTPKSSHAHRAHPANLGRALMLRRSYSFDPPEGAGLLFVAYLADPQTFVATQRRLDELDDLIAHTRTDASGCFFVPGDLV